MGTGAIKIKLLLVDDEFEFLNSASISLSRRDFQVTAASNGMEALRLMALQEFDAAVLDVKMPGIDGVELLRKIREIDAEMPVLMLTGHGNIPDAFESIKVGALNYLSKPYDIDALAEKVKKAVESRGKAVNFSSETTNSRQTETIRVLLVDDEEELLSSLSPVLRRRGFMVEIAQSGDEALQLAGERNFDVIVLDIRMPGMDGIETLKRLREIKQNFEAIILTGHPSVKNAFESVKQGAAEYLTKPPNIDDLAELIKKSYAKLAMRRQDLSKNVMKEILERQAD